MELDISLKKFEELVKNNSALEIKKTLGGLRIEVDFSPVMKRTESFQGVWYADKKVIVLNGWRALDAADPMRQLRFLLGHELFHALWDHWGQANPAPELWADEAGEAFVHFGGQFDDQMVISNHAKVPV